MSTRFYEFGPFQIDKLNHVLLRDGETLPLKPKVFDTLLLLVENRGRVLDKDELLSRLWPDTVVEESNLSQNVYLLRKVLDEVPRGEAYIETMPKRGYRFVASVNEVEEAGTDALPKELSQPRLVVEEKDESSFAHKYAAEAEQSIQEKALAASRWEKQTSSWKLGALALAGFLFVFGVASTIFYVSRTSKSKSVAARAPIKSIAVLPFKSLGTDPSDDYLGLAIADTLITRLSNVRQIKVRPTSAVRKYARPDLDVLAAGREQNVDFVLEGSTQRSGDTIRVTLRLVNVQEGSPVWSFKGDEQSSNLLVMQDSISEQIARALIPTLTGEQRNLLAKHYTENAEAHELYMRGRYLWNTGAADVEKNRKAIEFFNRALEKDPKFALAYSALADTYIALAADVGPSEVMPKAKDAAAKALALDDALPEAHVSLGRVKAYYDWQWLAAEEEFKRALALNPNSADAHREYGFYLTSLGRNDEAIAETKQGQELGDPFSFGVLFALAGARQYDQVIEEGQKRVKLEPNSPYIRFWMGVAYDEKGMHEEAITELQQAVNLSRGATIMEAQLGHAFAVAGRKSEAENILSELKALAGQRYVSPYDIALIYIGLGDKDQAFGWLEKAYAERARRLWALKVNPAWDSLRADPRFANLLRRIGLPQ